MSAACLSRLRNSGVVSGGVRGANDARGGASGDGASSGAPRTFAWDWAKWAYTAGVQLDEMVTIALDLKAAGEPLPTELPYFSRSSSASKLVLHTKGPSEYPRLSFTPTGSTQMVSVEKLKMTISAPSSSSGEQSGGAQSTVLAAVASKYSAGGPKSKLTMWTNAPSPDGDGNAGGAGEGTFVAPLTPKTRLKEKEYKL